MRKNIVFLICIFVQSLQASTDTEAIGVKTFSYVDPHRQRPITVEFWYPTQETRTASSIEDVWVHPREIRDANFSKDIQLFPLIVMSHGFGGDRRDRSWLAEILVKQGFLVASIDHYGNTWATMSIVESLRFWERPRDISFVLDKLMLEPLLKTRIHPEKIGFVGYSLGGMTGLALAGAVAENVKEVVEKYRESMPEITTDALSQVDFSPSGNSYFEGRVKAVLLLAPATWCFIHPRSLKTLKTPIALVATFTDDILPFEEHFQPLINYSIPTRLKLLRNGATHFAFLNRVSDKGRKILKTHVYKDPPGVERSEMHREIGAFATDFFKAFLQK